MTDTPQKTGLTAAVDHAKTYDTASLDTAIAPCPIRDNLIYIVPTRHALAEQESTYTWLLPTYLTGKSMAVRKLRVGYLYIWQPSFKLRQFTITKEGSFIEQISYSKTPEPQGSKYGITVNGDEPLYLLYLEGVPLTQEKFNQLNDSQALREKQMAEIDAQKLSYHNPQFNTAPITDAEQIMAELQPANEEKQKVLAFYKAYPNYPDLSMYSSDYARDLDNHYQDIHNYILKQATANNWSEQETLNKKMELNTLINKYPRYEIDKVGIWSASPWQSKKAIQTWLANIDQESQAVAAKCLQNISYLVLQKGQQAQQQTDQQKQQTQDEMLDLMMRSNYYRGNLPSYFIILEDPIGLMQDIESTQIYEASRHERWLTHNSVRTTIAGFIRNLATANPSELKSRLTYRFKGKYQPTDQQISQITELQQQIAARHQQYVTAYAAYLKAEPNTASAAYLKARIAAQLQLAYNKAKERYKKGLPFQAKVEPNGNTLDQDVAIITQPTRAYIPADIFDELWDDVSLYFYQKQQNIKGKNTSAEINQRTKIFAVDYWLDTSIPNYQRHLDKLHKQLLDNRGKLIPSVYQHLAWRIDGSQQQHRECLDNVGYTCFMQQTATLKGVEQMVDIINTEQGAEIFTLLTTRGIPILDATVNIGARVTELIDVLSNDHIASSTAMVNLLSDTLEPAKASLFSKAKLAEALASTEQAANGKWGELMRSFSSALIKLITNTLTLPANVANYGMVSIYNKAYKGLLDPIQFIPTRALPTIIMAWFSDSFTLQTEAGKLTITGQKATLIDQGIKEFVIEAPKLQTAQTTDYRLTRYKQAGNVGGIVAIVMAVINTINAGLYFTEAQQNPERTAQQQADAWSAYLYAGSAITGIIANGYGTYLQGIKAKGFILTTMQGFYFTSLGALTGGLGAFAAFEDSTSLSIQIANSGNNVDPAITYRYYAANAQMVIYGTQAAIGAGLALATLTGVISASTAVGLFTLFMGPIAWLLLAAGAVYLWAWSQQETPLQHYLSGCCWGTRPKYPNPTATQLVEDLAELIKLLFKPTLISEYQLASPPDRPIKGYRDAYYADVYRRLKQLAIYLPAADQTAQVKLALKAKHTKLWHNDIKNILAGWQQRTKAQWIPHQIGQGILLQAELEALEIEELEAHIYYTNPIINLYNKQIAEINEQLQVEDYYFLVKDSGVEEITNPRNCRYLTVRDTLTALPAQQLIPQAEG